nr:uncharacterized protein LOC106836618 isoform X4 [Equus asinus]
MKAVTSSWRDFTHHVPFEAVRSTAQSAARSPVRIPAAVPWPSPRFPAGDPAAGTGRDRPTARLLRPASSPASALLPLLHLRSASRYSKPCDSGSCDSRQSGAAGERQLREAESLYVTKLGRDGDRSQTTVRGLATRSQAHGLLSVNAPRAARHLHRLGNAELQQSQRKGHVGILRNSEDFGKTSLYVGRLPQHGCQAVPCPHPGSEPANPGLPRSGTCELNRCTTGPAPRMV